MAPQGQQAGIEELCEHQLAGLAIHLLHSRLPALQRRAHLLALQRRPCVPQGKTLNSAFVLLRAPSSLRHVVPRCAELCAALRAFALQVVSDALEPPAGDWKKSMVEVTEALCERSFVTLTAVRSSEVPGKAASPQIARAHARGWARSVGGENGQRRLGHVFWRRCGTPGVPRNSSREDWQNSSA